MFQLIAIEIDNHQLITRTGHSLLPKPDELSRNSMHSVPFLSLCHLHSIASNSVAPAAAAAAAEQICTPSIHSACIARKWDGEQEKDCMMMMMTAIKTDKRNLKMPDVPSSVFMKTACVIRSVNFTNHFIRNRFSFPQ